MRIQYPELLCEGAPLTVEQFSLPQAMERAPAFLDLIVSSYSKLFEGPGRPLPEGTFAERYGTAKKLQDFREHIIPGVFKQGGMYLGALNATGDRLVGSIKTVSGDTIEPDGRFSGMVGIAEILVNPRYQGIGIGAALAHAYFKHSEPPVDSTARVVIDAFEGSAINNWYERLGFENAGPSGELDFGNGLELPTHYMVTPESIVAGSIIRRFEHRYPELASAIID